MRVMYIFVGLGNIGEKYALTRHNAGRRALVHFVHARGGSWVRSLKYVAQMWKGVIGDEEVLALLPETFMNHSGSSIQKAVTSKKQAEKLVVLYDDIDLPLGTVRISFNRGSGGHNGIKSVTDSIKTEAFARIRVGISLSVKGLIKKPKDGEAVLEWVMGEFKKSEEKKMEEVFVRVGEIMEHMVTHGVPSAMNMFN